jgi:hypothetical protein
MTLDPGCSVVKIPSVFEDDLIVDRDAPWGGAREPPTFDN